MMYSSHRSQFQTKQLSVGLHNKLENEWNLCVEIFWPHVKLIPQIPIEMTGIRSQNFP